MSHILVIDDFIFITKEQQSCLAFLNAFVNLARDISNNLKLATPHKNCAWNRAGLLLPWLLGCLVTNSKTLKASY